MFTKVSKFMGQMSTDDIIETIVKDAMKVRMSFLFIYLIYISHFLIIGHSQCDSLVQVGLLVYQPDGEDEG